MAELLQDSKLTVDERGCVVVTGRTGDAGVTRLLLFLGFNPGHLVGLQIQGE